MTVVPDVGVRLSGLIFDAGPVNSPVLLTVGTAQPGPGAAHDPDLVQDTFFRIGGETVGSASVSFVDNADYSIVDNVWAWRADHASSPTVPAGRSTGAAQVWSSMATT